MNNYRISAYKLFVIIALFILLMPDYIKRFSIFSNIYNIFNVVLFLLLIIIFFLNKKREKLTFFEILIFVFHLYFLLVSIISGNSTYTNYLTIVNQLTLCMIVLVGKKEMFQESFSAVVFVTTVLVILNFITLLAVPDGLNIFYTGYGTATPAWLLGTKNPTSRFIIISLCLRLCYKNIFYKKKSILDIIMILISFIDVIKLESATGIVALIIMIFVTKFAERINLSSKLNYTTIFVGGALLSLLIIFCNIQNMFSGIIVNLLHRDASFSNRTIIWNKSMELITKNPIIGYGFQSDTIMFNNLAGYHPHNFYLFILYSTGLIGFGLLFLLFKEMSKNMEQSLSSKMGIVLFISLIVMGITESLTSTPLLYLSFIIIYFINLYVDKGDKHEKRE